MDAVILIKNNINVAMLATLPAKLGSWKKIAKLIAETRKMEKKNITKFCPGGL